jgi:hypothetical protein
MPRREHQQDVRQRRRAEFEELLFLAGMAGSQ